jgi:signal transduction histidine kinase
MPVRRSLLRVGVQSVLLCWVGAALVAWGYARSASWVDHRAQTTGVFYVFGQVDAAPPAERAARLAALQPHFWVPFELMDGAKAAALAGRTLKAGEQVRLRVSPAEQWMLQAFHDGAGVFAAGPVHPVIPGGIIPVGLIAIFILLPLVAGLLALRIERDLADVERAARALALGELGARAAVSQRSPNQLAQTFNEMAERIERLVRSRDELVQAVSHELGSPLARLRFHLELQQTQGKTRSVEMARELDALEALVAELLSYVQSDEVALQRTAFAPARGLRDLTELATLEAPDGKVVDIEQHLDDHVTLRADHRLFLRAIENLLRNAVRHASGRVRLELNARDGWVDVLVHDDGPGFPAEAREEIVRPFVRLQPDRDRRTGGVGLGLAIVHRILERHGGALTLDDSPLGGAVVQTTWPT